MCVVGTSVHVWTFGKAFPIPKGTASRVAAFAWVALLVKEISVAIMARVAAGQLDRGGRADAAAFGALASSLLGIVYLASAPVIHFILRRAKPVQRKIINHAQDLRELEGLIHEDPKRGQLIGSAPSAMDIWDSEKENWKRRRAKIMAGEERDRMETGISRKKRTAAAAAAALVGRKQELARLNTIVQGLLTMQGEDTVQSKCIYLEGEPGIGKTSLANAIILRTLESNGHVASTSCTESTHLESFATLSKLVTCCFPDLVPQSIPSSSKPAGKCEDSVSASTTNLAADRQKYFEALCKDDVEIRELLPLLNPLVYTGVPENYFTRAVVSQPGSLKQTVNVFLHLVKRKYADRFLVLFVDDYHLADAMTMSFLNELICDATPRDFKLIVIICADRVDWTAQSSPFDATTSPTDPHLIRELINMPNTTRIILPPLSDTDSRELLRVTMGKVAEHLITDDQAAKIVQDSKGMPLLLVRMGEALRGTTAASVDESEGSRSRPGGKKGSSGIKTSRSTMLRSGSRETLGGVREDISYDAEGDITEESKDSRVVTNVDAMVSSPVSTVNDTGPRASLAILQSPLNTVHIKDLWEEELQYLSLCSCLGASFFEVELLFYVYVRLFPATGMPQLLATLEQLERKGLIAFKKRQTRFGGMVEGYGFDHVSTRDALFAHVAKDRLEIVERVIAEWFETKLPNGEFPLVAADAKSEWSTTAPVGSNDVEKNGREGAGFATIALHLERGRLYKKAALYYIMAAEHDVGRYNGRTARACLRRAISMANILDQQGEESIPESLGVRIDYLMSISSLQSGFVSESIEYADASLARVAYQQNRLALGPRASLVRELALAALGWRFPNLFLRWDDDEATYQEGTLLKNIWLVKVFSHLDRITSLRMTLYTVNVLERYYRPTPELLISYGHLIYALGLRRRLRHLQTLYIQRARAVARQLTDLYAAVEYQTFIAYSSISQGLFPKGVAELNQALDVARKLPNHERTYVYTYLFQLTALFYVGRFGEAAEKLEAHIQPFVRDQKEGDEDPSNGTTTTTTITTAQLTLEHLAFLLEINLHRRGGLEVITSQVYPKIRDLAIKFRRQGARSSAVEFRVLAGAALFATIASAPEGADGKNCNDRKLGEAHKAQATPTLANVSLPSNGIQKSASTASLGIPKSASVSAMVSASDSNPSPTTMPSSSSRPRFKPEQSNQTPATPTLSDARALLSLLLTHISTPHHHTGEFDILHGLAISHLLQTILRLRSLLPDSKDLDQHYWAIHALFKSTCCDLYPFMKVELLLYEAVYAFVHSRENVAAQAIVEGLGEARRYGMRFHEGWVAAHAKEMFPRGVAAALGSGAGAFVGVGMADVDVPDPDAIAKDLECEFHVLPLKRKFWWGLWKLQRIRPVDI
ncbi:hypothetical protein HK104_000908 [Borealophlyctis nickersoniae]|nr:hypothetical protein HK104_000908 [Borealophlyctis nickersoniae]